MQVLAAVLPWPVKRLLYRWVFRWTVEPGAHVGLCVITARHVHLDRGATIGHFNVVRNLPHLVLGADAVIGQWNWVTCGEFFTDGEAAIPPPRDQGLFMAPKSALTSRHYLDCPGGVFIDEYACVGGIPVLRPDQARQPEDAPSRDATAHKRQQMLYYDAEADPELETNRPHGLPRLYGWLLGEKFRRSLQALSGEVAGRTALTVCGGSGLDAEYLARAGARVILSDLSLEAARRARERAGRYGFMLTAIVADAEHLPFPDRAVDLVYVHDGLHHLEQPLRGLAEMARVAGRTVSMNEPARAATAAAMRVGLAQRVEDAGNVVARLDPDAAARTLQAHGFDVVHVDRYAMWYRQRPGPGFVVLSLPGLYPLARLGWRAGNRLLGRVGNKLTVQAVRRRAGGDGAGEEG